MATLIKPNDVVKPLGRVRSADFKKMMSVCKSPPKASMGLKTRMAAAKLLIKSR